MWETIKKDSLIKTIVVILLGVLAFGIAFQIMFGAGGGMEEGSMGMKSGYTLSAALAKIINLLVQLIIIGLLLGGLLWIVKAVKKQLITGDGNNSNSLFEDPIIRKTLMVVTAVILVGFLFYILDQIVFTGSYHSEMMYGYNYFSFSNILVLVFKFLILALFLSLGICVFKYIQEISKKNANLEKQNNTEVKDHKVCPECNYKLADSWKCCPNCGSEKAFK